MCLNVLYILGLVVLLTGSNDQNAGKTAEIYNPSNRTSCNLPNLPDIRYFHTQDGNLLCGSNWDKGTQTSCLTWYPDEGKWHKSHTLPGVKSKHVSFTPSNGIGTYLLGGKRSAMATVLVKPDGTVSGEFQLKHSTA